MKWSEYSDIIGGIIFLVFSLCLIIGGPICGFQQITETPQIWVLYLIGIGISLTVGIALLKFSINAIKEALENLDRHYNNKPVNNTKETFRKDDTNLEIKTSKWEDSIAEWINNNYNYNIQRNNRTIIPGKDAKNNLEIDIYIPQLKLGIECNGEYWHDKYAYEQDKYNNSENTEEMYKENYCKSHGINLIHVWDSQEFDEIKEIIDSAIKDNRN